MTIGQLCFYDQIKQTLLATDYFGDNLVTHFTSSLGAVRIQTEDGSFNISFCQGAIATTMTQPLDVLKTRSMNAKPGASWSLLFWPFYSFSQENLPALWMCSRPPWGRVRWHSTRATFPPSSASAPRPSSPSSSLSSSEWTSGSSRSRSDFPCVLIATSANVQMKSWKYKHGSLNQTTSR